MLRMPMKGIFQASLISPLPLVTWQQHSSQKTQPCESEAVVFTFDICPAMKNSLYDCSESCIAHCQNKIISVRSCGDFPFCPAMKNCLLPAAQLVPPRVHHTAAWVRGPEHSPGGSERHLEDPDCGQHFLDSWHSILLRPGLACQPHNPGPLPRPWITPYWG